MNCGHKGVKPIPTALRYGMAVFCIVTKMAVIKQIQSFYISVI